MAGTAVNYSEDDVSYVLDMLSSEITSVGKGDFKEPSLVIDNGNDYILDLVYQDYKINKESKSCSNYVVYENNTCTEPHSNLLIPKVFLEAIQIGDENILKKYLSYQLLSTPINKFQSYFGNIKELYLNRHMINQDKLNYTILSNGYKNYNFVMENNKIKDIEEIF
jgi:alpha-galactosidase